MPGPADRDGMSDSVPAGMEDGRSATDLRGRPPRDDCGL